MPNPPSSWRESAACIGKTSIFYPPLSGGKPPHPLDPVWAAPRSICATCPVRVSCLNDAMTDTWATDGMWGGLTPAERMLAYRKRMEVRSRRLRGLGPRKSTRNLS